MLIVFHVVNEEKTLTSSFEFFDHRIPKSCLFNAVSIGSGMLISHH